MQEPCFLIAIKKIEFVNRKKFIDLIVAQEGI